METPTTNTPIEFSNVSVVRDVNGALSVWVDGKRMLGTTNVALQSLNDGTAALTLAVPSSRLRFAEREPAPVVYENKDNVMQFPKLRAALAATTPDTTPPVVA